MSRCRRIWRGLVFIWICVFFLTSCWDNRELEDLFVAYTAGIDISEEDPNLLSLSFSGPTVEEKAEVPNISVVGQGRSIQDAMINIQSKLYREVVLGHVQVLLIGEDTAREGISAFLDAFKRNPDVRGTFILGVTQGKAEDIIIGVNLRNQPFVGIYLKELLRGANREGIAHALTLMEFYRYMNIDGIDPCMPYLMIAPTKDHILVNHTAVFRGDRFVGILEQDESIAVMILKNLVKEGRMAMDLSSSEEGGLHDSIAVDLYRTSRKITPMIDGERVKIKIEVKVTGQLLEHTLSERSLSYSSIKRQESLFGEKLKNDMKKALSKLQEYQADIVGFGEIVRVKYPEFFDKEKWREDFAGAEFDIDVDFWIKRIGTAS